MSSAALAGAEAVEGERAGARPPAVSFIVPVYRSEATLAACLDSILAQSLDDIEVVCVNDGSPDGCGAILDAYAARDARVRVITQENRGLSAARNAGMDAARGVVVDFVDSDDTVLPELAQVLTSTFARTGAEVVTFGAMCEPPEQAGKRIQQLLSPAAATYESFNPDLLFCANAQPYAWRTALRREFMEHEHIRFSERVRFAEDVPYQFTVYPLSKKTVLLPDKLYRYRMTEGSLTHVYNTSASRAQKVEQHLVMLGVIFDEWHARGLLACCPGRMVTWCLDLLLFDLARLETTQATAYAGSLDALLRSAYGDGWCELPEQAPVRAVAARVARAAAGDGFALGKLSLVRFFVATRGLKQCIERFI